MTGPNSASSAWIRSYHPAEASVARLVCFPHAGGSATFFHPVSARFSPDVEVVAIQYPGRQDRRREPAIETVGELADRIAAELAGLSVTPQVFFGHSMGAVLAFEVTRRLEEREANPPHAVIASGRRAPPTIRNENVHTRSDDGVIKELKSLSGTDSALLGDEEILRMILPAIRSDYKAIETYMCDASTTVRAPITVLTGDSDPKTTLDEARAEVSDRVAGTKRQAQLDQYLSHLRSQAIIDWKNDEIKKAFEVGVKQRATAAPAQ